MHTMVVQLAILSTRRIMVPPLILSVGMKKGPNLRWSLIQCSGGDEGDRTPDLLTASQALSQLSYAPVRRSTIRELARRCKDNFRKTFAGADTCEVPRCQGPMMPDPSREPLDAFAPNIRLDRALPRSSRIKTMPVYYDESGLCKRTRHFAKESSVLPAVL